MDPTANFYLFGIHWSGSGADNSIMNAWDPDGSLLQYVHTASIPYTFGGLLPGDVFLMVASAGILLYILNFMFSVSGGISQQSIGTVWKWLSDVANDYRANSKWADKTEIHNDAGSVFIWWK